MKIKGKVYPVVNIRWRWGLSGWASWPTSPTGLELYFIEPFYYTAPPPSKHKNEKIWGQCKKPKIQKQMEYIDLDRAVVYMGNRKFRLFNEDERTMFVNYYETLTALEKL